MKIGGTVSGVVGRIKWSYYVAAAINGYKVSRLDDRLTWTLRANVVMADAYKMAQRPLVFEAPHARGIWKWAITDFDLHGGVMTARLRNLEEL